MKKRVLFAGLILIIITAYLVSAQSIGENLKNIFDEFAKAIEPIASMLLGDTPSGEFLFAKIIFFLIIFGVIWIVLDQVEFFSEYTWVVAIISIGVSILATRWIASEALVQTILLPYSALGFAVAAGIPFVIYFLLVNVGFKNQPPIFRKIAWIFFAVIFVCLWLSRGPLGTDVTKDWAWIYPVTALLSLIMAAMDGTFSKFFMKVQIEKSQMQAKTREVLRLQDEINTVNRQFSEGTATEKQRDRIVKENTKKILALSK
jgi:hypothetical protein